ncbi:MAG: type II toxin-antitoxin system RelE family toxin [Acidobacteriota bacterium]
MSSSFEVRWHEKAVKDLKNLDKETIRRIIDKVKNHLNKRPLKLSKSLKGRFRGLYRYRIGDYRVIFVLDHEKKELLVLAVNHRKNIYKS